VPPRDGPVRVGAPRGGSAGDGPVPWRGGPLRGGAARVGCAGDGPVPWRGGPPRGGSARDGPVLWRGGPPRGGAARLGCAGDGPVGCGGDGPVPGRGGAPRGGSAGDGPVPSRGGAPRGGSAGGGPVRVEEGPPRGGRLPGVAVPPGGGRSAGAHVPLGGAAIRATAVRPGGGGTGLPAGPQWSSGGWSEPGSAGPVCRGRRACASDWPRGCSSARPPAEPMARAYPSERVTTCGQAFCRFQARLALTVIGYGRYPSQASMRISMPAVPAQRGWSRGGGCGDSLAWTTTPGAGPRIRSHM
jgi:hypothetical protein